MNKVQIFSLGHPFTSLQSNPKFWLRDCPVEATYDFSYVFLIERLTNFLLQRVSIFYPIEEIGTQDSSFLWKETPRPQNPVTEQRSPK